MRSSIAWLSGPLPRLAVLAVTVTVLMSSAFGCAVSSGTAKLDSSDLPTQLKPGESTKDQVIALLGEPWKRRVVESKGYPHEWWEYEFKASTINPLDYLLLVGFFRNGIGAYDRETVLTIAFDTDGKIASLLYQQSSYDNGGMTSPTVVKSRAVTDIVPSRLAPRAVHYEDSLEARY